jgi:hypothetical protein
MGATCLNHRPHRLTCRIYLSGYAMCGDFEAYAIELQLFLERDGEILQESVAIIPNNGLEFYNSFTSIPCVSGTYVGYAGGTFIGVQFGYDFGLGATASTVITC